MSADQQGKPLSSVLTTLPPEHPYSDESDWQMFHYAERLSAGLERRYGTQSGPLNGKIRPSQGTGMTIRSDRFRRFACFDWSGQNVARPRGIALAVAEQTGAPELVTVPGGWSREGALDWLREIAASGEDILIGFDLSPALPFVDQGGYFPGWSERPISAKKLWALIDNLCTADPHLTAAGFLSHPGAENYFRQHGGRRGERFGDDGRGRLRQCEKEQLKLGLSPSSCFNLVGAAQVGKSSLTGMRLLNRFDGAIPFWPFDPIPEKGPVLVEIYTTIAARAADPRRGRSKIKGPAELDRALFALGSPSHTPLARYDDHSTDAIVTAAWLRTKATDPALWNPREMTPLVAATEGWTFGVP